MANTAHGRTQQTARHIGLTDRYEMSLFLLGIARVQWIIVLKERGTPLPVAQSVCCISRLANNRHRICQRCTNTRTDTAVTYAITDVVYYQVSSNHVRANIFSPLCVALLPVAVKLKLEVGGL